MRGNGVQVDMRVTLVTYVVVAAVAVSVVVARVAVMMTVSAP
jgi:hypothetical protein